MIWRLFKLAVVVVLIVIVVGKLPDRTQTTCTATVTADDGTVIEVPCK